MLNLFPDYKADAVIQRVFTDILVSEDKQPPVITPFANAGRWEREVVPPTDFASFSGELPVGVSLSPQEVFSKIMKLDDDKFADENLFDRKVSVAREAVAQIFGGKNADKCLTKFEATRLSRLGEGNTENLPLIKIENRQSLKLAVSKASGVSLSEATRLIVGGAVRVNGEKITGRGVLLPIDASVLSIGKQKAWRVEFKKGE